MNRFLLHSDTKDYVSLINLYLSIHAGRQLYILSFTWIKDHNCNLKKHLKTNPLQEYVWAELLSEVCVRSVCFQQICYLWCFHYMSEWTSGELYKNAHSTPPKHNSADFKTFLLRHRASACLLSCLFWAQDKNILLESHLKAEAAWWWLYSNPHHLSSSVSTIKNSNETILCSVGWADRECY